MKPLLLLCLLAMGLAGCGRDVNRGEICALGLRFSLMERISVADNHVYFWLAEVVSNDKGKPIPCPEQRP